MHALGCLAYSARSLHVPASGRYADLDICTKPSAGCLNSPSLAMCCALELDSVMRFVDNDSITGYWKVMFPFAALAVIRLIVCQGTGHDPHIRSTNQSQRCHYEPSSMFPKGQR